MQKSKNSLICMLQVGPTVKSRRELAPAVRTSSTLTVRKNSDIIRTPTTAPATTSASSAVPFWRAAPADWSTGEASHDTFYPHFIESRCFPPILSLAQWEPLHLIAIFSRIQRRNSPISRTVTPKCKNNSLLAAGHHQFPPFTWNTCQKQADD